MNAGFRVLLVDDDPIARAELTAVYQANGMAVTAVGDARSFFAELSKQTPDLCLVDVILPDATGLQVTGEIRSRPELVKVAVVGLTGRLDPKILSSAFAAGADDFMFKPVMGEELLTRSRLAIQRRREGASLGGRAGSRRCELTTLFCDVRGFTALAATHDPEWVVEVLNGLFERLVFQLNARGGEADKFLGDGLLAFFGALGSSRDREYDAIEAALAMVETTRDYSRESLLLGGRPLSVGVGIASGSVVIAPVGPTAQRQVTAIGDSVNLASRLQGLAAEGEVLVCERTFERVAGRVRTSGARAVELKGITGTPRVYPVSLG
ncbi:MAG: adenylate/guanylate cyclase domain-containing protein [Myxococcaceae bacterium]